MSLFRTLFITAGMVGLASLLMWRIHDPIAISPVSSRLIRPHNRRRCMANVNPPVLG